MNFPINIHAFGFQLHPHPVLEVIAYTTGFQIFLRTRKRFSEDDAPVSFERMMWVIVGCVVGALVGSKLLAWIESINEYWPRRFDPAVWMGGKTIVGGLLGGWIGVEIAKRVVRVRRSTGDAFVFPIIVGLSIGRVGCFLTGLADHTYGTFTTLPWAVNFGDGPRHPTQLYEIGFLLLLGAALKVFRARRALAPGALFRWFMLGYLAFRFCVEFIKPSYKPYAGLSAIQLTCGIGIVVCVVQLMRRDVARASRPLERYDLPGNPDLPQDLRAQDTG